MVKNSKYILPLVVRLIGKQQFRTIFGSRISRHNRYFYEFEWSFVEKNLSRHFYEAAQLTQVTSLVESV